jgi:hypothetical protein
MQQARHVDTSPSSAIKVSFVSCATLPRTCPCPARGSNVLLLITNQTPFKCLDWRETKTRNGVLIIIVFDSYSATTSALVVTATVMRLVFPSTPSGSRTEQNRVTERVF